MELEKLNAKELKSELKECESVYCGLKEIESMVKSASEKFRELVNGLESEELSDFLLNKQQYFIQLEKEIEFFIDRTRLYHTLVWRQVRFGSRK